ncbi:MAG: DUF3048 domain-containing protein [Acidimicrobiales bacterium]
MSRLRARHWFAVILALGLVVVAYRVEATVQLAAGNTQALRPAEAEPPDGLALLRRTSEEAVAQTDNDPEQTDSTSTADRETALERGLPVLVAPLTGLPTDVETAGRSALVMKIDNHPRARAQQTGLDQADIVFDLRAEGVTRFAAVFQSQIPDPVGPVRSSRTSDFDILRGFDTPLYGSSGGNDYVTNGLRNLPIVELTNRTRNEYFRNFSHPAPHNLYVNGSDLYDLAPSDLPVPQPWFQYRRAGEQLPDAARAAVGPISVAFRDSPLVTHEWDDRAGGWLRTQDGRPHTTVDGDQLAPENVVIMITDYRTSPADPVSPEVRSTGRGEAVVLTDGMIIRGFWERVEAEDKLTITDGEDTIISLTPGRTWVLMPEEGQVGFADGQLLGPPLSSG